MLLFLRKHVAALRGQLHPCAALVLKNPCDPFRNHRAGAEGSAAATPPLRSRLPDALRSKCPG